MDLIVSLSPLEFSAPSIAFCLTIHSVHCLFTPPTQTHLNDMDSSFAIPSKVIVSATGALVSSSAAIKGLDGDLPKAIDLSHHLSRLAKNRSPSSLKELYKYMNIKGMGG